LHDRIISIKGKGWAHETSVILPRYLNTCTKVEKWAIMYRCVTGIDFEINDFSIEIRKGMSETMPKTLQIVDIDFVSRSSTYFLYFQCGYLDCLD
jgi:hypothetical protein